MLKGLRFEKIDNLDRPELQPYRTMRRQLEHREQGIFVAEGEKVVRRLLESRLEVVSLLLPEKWLYDLMPLLERREIAPAIYVAEKKMLESMTGFSMYQGLLAVGKIPVQPNLEPLLSSTTRPHLLVAIESLSSAENVGAVVRNCAAFNAQALITGETCTSPFLRRAVRSSMGAIFHLPVIESRNLVTDLASLRQRGIRTVAAHPHASGKTPAQTRFNTDCCLVFGSEGYGLSAPVLEVCDEAVAVPMPTTVDSLNVASACSVFLYEVSRQRTAEDPAK